MQIDKRRLLGPLFPVLSKIRHSPFARRVEAALWLPVEVVRQRLNRPLFFVEASGTKGMGALICEALLLIRYAHSKGLQPRIVSFNPLYRGTTGVDVLSEYFRPSATVPLPRWRAMAYRNLHSWPHLHVPQHMTFSEAADLLKAFFSPAPDVERLVDEELARVPGRAFDVSVHYRGTDKALEAPLVGFTTFFDATRNALAEVSRAGHAAARPRIFLATDSVEFKRAFRDAFAYADIFMYETQAEGDFARGRHFSSMPPRSKALEALVNIHLIARAVVCVRGASYLSAVSALVNPRMRTQTLNRDHWGSTGFPEAQILEREAAHRATSTRTILPGHGVAPGASRPARHPPPAAGIALPAARELRRSPWTQGT